MKKVFVLIVAIGLLIFVIDWSIDYYSFVQERRAVENLVHDKIPESISKHDSATWKRVESEKYGISMKIPKDFVIEEITYKDGTERLEFWEVHDRSEPLDSYYFDDVSDTGRFSQEFSFEFYTVNNEDDILLSLQQIKHFSNEETVIRVMADESCFSCNVPFVKFHNNDLSNGIYFVLLQDLAIVINAYEYYIPALIQTISIL